MKCACKQFNSLCPSDRKKIADIVDEQENKDIMRVLDTYMKMSCQILHDNFGFGEKRLTMFLAAYRMMFRRHKRFVAAKTQSQELDAEMCKIFKKDGYPDEFFKSMLDDWDIETKSKTTERENK